MMDFVPFPSFSYDKVALWFVKLESVFVMNGIDTDPERYDYLISQLPLEFMTLVEDIILNPPSANKYQNFKIKFIKRITMHRLKNEPIGDDKPSEYLKRLKKIAAQYVSQDVVMQTWIKNLPPQVRDIVSLETSQNPDTVGLMADKLIALLPTSAPQQNELPTPLLFEALSGINELKNRMKMLQMMHLAYYRK